MREEVPLLDSWIHPSSVLRSDPLTNAHTRALRAQCVALRTPSKKSPSVECGLWLAGGHRRHRGCRAPPPKGLTCPSVGRGSRLRINHLAFPPVAACNRMSSTMAGGKKGR